MLAVLGGADALEVVWFRTGDEKVSMPPSWTTTFGSKAGTTRSGPGGGGCGARENKHRHHGGGADRDQRPKNSTKTWHDGVLPRRVWAPGGVPVCRTAVTSRSVLLLAGRIDSTLLARPAGDALARRRPVRYPPGRRWGDKGPDRHPHSAGRLFTPCRSRRLTAAEPERDDGHVSYISSYTRGHGGDDHHSD